MILVAGATGRLGRAICRRLRADDLAVRGLVRFSSDPAAITELIDLGVEPFYGDLKDYVSLKFACAGVTSVISTASALFSYRTGDTLDAVDRRGQVKLIDAARTAGAEHFVLVSARFPPDLQSPISLAKQAAERHLIASGMTYTILRPAPFMETWLTPTYGFEPQRRRARIWGDGMNEISWISLCDVAAFADCVLRYARGCDCALEIGGPEALTMLDTVARFAQVAGAPFKLEFTPLHELREQVASAIEPRGQSVAALKLQLALGCRIDMDAVLRDLPVVPTTILDFAARAVEVTPLALAA